MRTILSAGLVSLALACGGEPKPAREPEPVIGANDGKADMPDPSGSKESPADHDRGKGKDEKVEAAGPGGGMLTAAAMKWVPAKKGANAATYEVKADGTILVSGKPKGKISGDQVLDDTGATLVTISVDGSLVGPSFTGSNAKLKGDDRLVSDETVLAIADDGTVKATRHGKEETVGKFEGATPASKRAALVVLALSSSSAKDGSAKPLKPPTKK